MKKKFIRFSLLMLLFVILDQLTKIIVVNLFNVGESKIIINNFFKFCYIRNSGASFGLLSNNFILLIIISLLLISYIAYDTYKNPSNLRLLSTSLIISGAIGNLADRLFRGYVVDFISFTLFNKEMAIFNVADMFITFGVIIYILLIFMEGKNERNKNKRRG